MRHLPGLVHDESDGLSHTDSIEFEALCAIFILFSLTGADLLLRSFSIYGKRNSQPKTEPIIVGMPSDASTPLLGREGSRDEEFPHRRARESGSETSSTTTPKISPVERAFIFLGIFIVGYAYGLESQLRLAYMPYATSSFNLHSYLATINVLRSIVAVAAQPTAAKVADVFGRFEIVVASTILYVIGIVAEAVAESVEVFCFGAIIYQLGYTCIVLLMEVLVADYSSMRSRVFLSYVPAVPFIINTWISGNITSAVLETTSWRWGIGMWAAIYLVASIPLLLTLFIVRQRQRTSERVDNSCDKFTVQHLRKRSVALFHDLDTIGLTLLVFAFSLVLAPLTITGREAHHWRNPSIVVPLGVGLLCAPVFVVWEKLGARTPVVPFHLLADRGVWSALAVRGLLNFAWYTQGNYLYTVLIVAFDFSVESATRVTSFYSFFGVVSGLITGVVIYRIRRLKVIIVVGTFIFMGAFGLLIAFPGGTSEKSQTGLLSGQIILGLAGGLFAYPTQASIQASAKREHVAVITGLYLSFYNVGSAVGTCLSGLIWTQTLLPTLQQNLAFQPNTSLAEAMYDSPFAVIPQYPVGTEIRDAIVDSYAYVQRILCIAGLAVCVPMIGFALTLRNPRLSEHQTQPEAEEHDET